jgi:predicted metal-dependent hydrolase
VSRVQVAEITVDVVRRRNVRNLNLTVLPPDGRVRVSAPRWTSLVAIQEFTCEKLEWIRRHRRKIRSMEREAPIRYRDGEVHRVWGRSHVLRVEERDEPPSVELTPRRLRLKVRPGTDRAGRRAIVEKWYRDELRAALPRLLARWERRLRVKTKHVYVRRMKTRWGTCNPRARTIRLNTELATRRPALLEYLVVHELVHFLEPTHNARFQALMDRYLPDWRERRDELNGQAEA